MTMEKLGVDRKEEERCVKCGKPLSAAEKAIGTKICNECDGEK